MTKKKRGKTRRLDRRFMPKSAQSPLLVRGLFALGASTLGAGAWAMTYGHIFEGDEKLRQMPLYLLSGGAVVLGVSLWLGTSSEPPLRVGAPGVGIERGEVRRLPWYGIEKIGWDEDALALVLDGVDESGSTFPMKVSVKSHPEAVGWILKEARERVPKVIDIDEDVLAKLPTAAPHAGIRLDLEPLQVVGKKCAVSDKLLSYEPDARVCTRCERVYHRRSVPRKCKCGASLAHLQPTEAEAKEVDEEERSESEAEEAES
jgi:hypothetical protein